jgi:hypothetical protein
LKDVAMVTTTPSFLHRTPPVTSLGRGLPPGWDVRRAVAGDAEAIAALLGDGDRAEMEALEGRPALDVLGGWMEEPSRVLTGGGEPVAIFGLIPCFGWPSDGPTHRPGRAVAAMPWAAVVSTLDADHLTELLWLARFQLDGWQRRWSRLQVLCDARNRFRAQWLHWLGFERQGRVERFGAAGVPFDLHVRLRRDLH